MTPQKSLCMWQWPVYILYVFHSPTPICIPAGQGWGVGGERRGSGPLLLEERRWCWRSPSACSALQFSLRGEEPPPASLLHIWLPPESSFGGKTRMFLFPRREEEPQGGILGPHKACCYVVMAKEFLFFSLLLLSILGS